MAEKTGWELRYIIDELPISIGTQLTDCWAWHQGAKLRWAVVDTDRILE